MSIGELFFYLLAFISVCIFLFLLCGFVVYHIREKFHYWVFPEVALVVKKEIVSKYVTIKKRTFVDTKYIIKFVYDGDYFFIDSKKLYNLVEKDDLINILVHKGYNRHGEERMFFTIDNE